MNRVYDFLGGRTATFIWVYTVAGITLTFFGKMTGEFVAFTTAVLGAGVVRAIGQDRTNPPAA